MHSCVPHDLMQKCLSNDWQLIHVLDVHKVLQAKSARQRKSQLGEGVADPRNRLCWHHQTAPSDCSLSLLAKPVVAFRQAQMRQLSVSLEYRNLLETDSHFMLVCVHAWCARTPHPHRQACKANGPPAVAPAHMQEAMSGITSLTARTSQTFAGSSGRCSRMLQVPCSRSWGTGTRKPFVCCPADLTQADGHVLISQCWLHGQVEFSLSHTFKQSMGQHLTRPHHCPQIIK